METQKMLEDIRTAMRAKSGGIKPTDWEEDFIENVGPKIDRRHSLSSAQLDKLKKIWDKI